MSNSRASNPAIRVLIVDDHTAVRAGIRMVIESHARIEVAGEAGNKADALSLAARTQPDLILLDLDLGQDKGLDLIPQLQAEAKSARILILTGVTDIDQHQAAVRSGAMGLVMKDISADLLIKAIERVHEGELWLDRSTTANLVAGMRRASDHAEKGARRATAANLTERELEVIALVGEALKNKQIASRLFISETTVRHHLTSIFEKLGVTDRLELLIFAYQNGLVKAPVKKNSLKSSHNSTFAPLR